MDFKNFLFLLPLVTFTSFVTIAQASTTVSITDSASISEIYDSGGGIGISAIPGSVDVLVLSTYGDLFNANIPNSVKEEILAEYSLTLNDMSGAILNTLLPKQEHIFLNSPGALTVKAGSGLSTSGCGGYWQAKTNEFNKSLSPFAGKIIPISKNNTGDTTYNLQASLPAVTGSLSGKVNYSLRRNKCSFNAAYRARFDGAEVNGNYTAGGKFDLTGQASYTKKQTLWSDSFHLLTYETRINILYIFEFHPKIDLDIDTRVDLDTKITGYFNISTDNQYTGKFNLTCNADLVCTSNSEQTHTKITAQNNENNSASVAIDITVTPVTDTHITANAYFGGVAGIGGQTSVETIRAGAVLELPVRTYNYLGNACSDANGDKTNELVKASVVDVNLEAWGYVVAKGIFKTVQAGNLRLPLGNATVLTKSKSIPLVNAPRDVSVQVKNLYFNDFGNATDSLFDPVATLNLATKTLTLSKRSCYPFIEGINYSIDWGDGSGVQTAAAPNGTATLIHNFTAADSSIKVRMTGDNAGRSYNRQNSVLLISKPIPIVTSAVQPIGSYKDLVAITGGNFNLTDKFTLYDANGSIWASNLSVAYTPGSNEKYTNFSLPSLKAPSGCNATTSCTLKFRVTNANGYAEGSVVIRMEPKPPIVTSAVQPIGSYEILVAITGGNFKLTDKFTLYDADGSIWASKLSVSYTPGSNDKYTNFSLPSLKAPSGCNTTTSCTLRFRVTNADGFAEGSVAIRKAP
jgi:hypothetical protein